MSYIDGFVIAVPTANKKKFIEFAGSVDTIFTDGSNGRTKKHAMPP